MRAQYDKRPVRAWYDKRTRMWALELSRQPLTYLRDETGELRYFLTAQDAYDAYQEVDL